MVIIENRKLPLVKVRLLQDENQIVEDELIDEINNKFATRLDGQTERVNGDAKETTHGPSHNELALVNQRSPDEHEQPAHVKLVGFYGLDQRIELHQCRLDNVNLTAKI